jgi:hypothetical protein
MVGVDGDAHRGGHGDGLLTRLPHRRGPDRLADLGRQRLRAGQIGLGRDQDQFLAPVAGEDVDLPHHGADPVGDLKEHCVAALVSVSVVDPLEAVEVEHQDGQRTVEAGGPLDLAGQRDDRVAVVPQSGQAVGDRQALGLLMQQDVVDRRNRLTGEGVHDLQVSLVERLSVGPVVESEHPGDPTAAAQWRGQHGRRGGLVRCGDQPVFADSPMHRRVCDGDAGGHARRSLGPPQTHWSVGLRAAWLQRRQPTVQTSPDAQVEHVSGRGREQQSAGRRPDADHRRVDDDAQDPVEVVRPGQRVAQT